MFGRDVPCISLAHQYLITESIGELSNRDKKLPLLRDPDSSYYLRQEKDGLLLGPYEKNCKAHWVSADDQMPEDFPSSFIPMIWNGWNGILKMPVHVCRYLAQQVSPVL